MHIGLFGGTFDPIHTGHLIISETIRCRLNLDQILFIPAALPPHKQGKIILSAEHRMHMLQLAVQDNAYFQISEYEIRQDSVSYTIDTIEYFQKTFPEHQFMLIIGTDSLDEIQSWKDPEKIFSLIPVIVAVRPGFELDQIAPDFKNHVRPVQAPRIEISSSFIRESVHRQQSIRYLVPASVENYIIEQGFYR